jgi:hypothetical protein
VGTGQDQIDARPGCHLAMPMLDQAQGQCQLVEQAMGQAGDMGAMFNSRLVWCPFCTRPQVLDREVARKNRQRGRAPDQQCPPAVSAGGVNVLLCLGSLDPRTPSPPLAPPGSRPLLVDGSIAVVPGARPRSVHRKPPCPWRYGAAAQLRLGWVGEVESGPASAR